MFPQLSTVHCPLALLRDGWQADVRIELRDGNIHSLQPNANPHPGDSQLSGPVIPGMANAHSHSFQRAMAGLAERRGSDGDNFWVWRDAMYRFAKRIDADDVSAIADQLYLQLLLNGYTSVGEFHYLHHAPDGRPYDNPAELSLRHLASALDAGIRLTHMPVLYSQGNFGGQPLEGAQLRFKNSADELLSILQLVAVATENEPTLDSGIAFHSLRAVNDEQIKHVLGARSSIRGLAERPVHIHVAEQKLEVADCQQQLGARPVQWLLDNQPVDHRWCLIHATHVDNSELSAMSQQSVTVGLCPTTEANLGDGVFPAEQFRQLGGRTAIGSDSHICVSAAEELRMLEYGQRLTTQRRNVLADSNQSVGNAMYTEAALRGSEALGNKAGVIEEGYSGDLVVLRHEHPVLIGKGADDLLDTYVFAGGATMVRDVIVGGRHIVQDGCHPNVKRVDAHFRSNMLELLKHTT